MALALLGLLGLLGLIESAGAAIGEPCDYDAISSERAAGAKELSKHGIGEYETFHLDAEILLGRHRRHHRARRSLVASIAHNDEIPFTLAVQAHGRELNLRLTAAGDKLFHPEFSVLVIQNDTEHDHPFDRSLFYHGTVDGEPHALVSAYVDDDVLVGTVHIPGEDDYFIERADKYFDTPGFTNIIYKGSDMVSDDGMEATFEGQSYGQLLERQRQYEAEAAAGDPDAADLGALTAPDPDDMDAAHHRQRQRRQVYGNTPYDPRKNTCGVALVADHKYMTHFANADGTFRRNEAIRSMVSLLDGASLIFRSTSFDPWKNGTTASGLAQFAANKVFVYEDMSESNPFRGRAACTSQDSCDASVECAQPFLDMLSATAAPDTTTNGWDDFCLVHSFTHRDFCGGILGLAWVARPGSVAAGICTKQAGQRSLNTGISTSINFGSAVSRQVQTITLAHEFGHNFGSSHDVGGLAADGQSCAPGGVSGNYIMYLKATDGDAVNNDKFSLCSVNAISEVIRHNSDTCFQQRNSVMCGSRVLVDVGQDGCGNGILDFDEDCDCSIDGATDSCCDCSTCKVDTVNIPTAQCSPVADPYCCFANCSLKGYSLEESLDKYRKALIEASSAVGPDNVPSIASINLRLADKFQNQGSPCGSGGDECTMHRYCIADPLFVPYKGQERGSCPMPDWVVTGVGIDNDITTAIADDQDMCFGFENVTGCSSAVRCESLVPSCFDTVTGRGSAGDCYLFHGSDQTTCNSGANLCRYNGCSGSICNLYNREDTTVGTASKCRLDQHDTACDIACIFNGTADALGPCISTKEFATHFPNSTQLAEIGSGGDLGDGRTCTFQGDRYGGRCSAGSCVEMIVDSEADVDIASVSRWMADNWQVVVGVVVGGIVIFILLKVTYVRKKPLISKAMGRVNKTVKRKLGLRDSTSQPNIANRPPMTSRTHKEMRSKMKKEEAITRLTIFFPAAAIEDIKKVLKASRNEEEAVKKLVKHGQAFTVPTEVPLIRCG